MDKLNLEAWAGSETTEYSSVTEDHARRVHATLGESEAPTHGAPLPLLWHWYAFLPSNPNANLARDRHPKRSGLMPPGHRRQR